MILNIFIAVIVFLLALPVAPVLVRRRAMRRFAREHNLTFLGKKLAEGLVLRKTYFGWRSEDIANSMTGMLGGIEVAISDFAFATDKGLLRQTLVAFRRDGLTSWPEAPEDKSGLLRLEVSGDWLIGYVEGRRVNANDLWDWCAQLRNVALKQPAPL